MEADADVAVAALSTGNALQIEPAFCLMKRELQPSLLTYLQSGGRKIEHWTAQQRRAEAVFDDTAAFFNVNSPADLARLQHP